MGIPTHQRKRMPGEEAQDAGLTIQEEVRRNMIALDS